MNKIKGVFVSVLCTFSVASYAQCSTPSQKVPVLDNYWELKIAQGFNDLNTIKKLDNTYCYNYLVNNEDYGNPIFQMFSKEQVDFFLKKIPNYKDYRSDNGLDLLLYGLSIPYMHFDYPTDDLKEYLLSRYIKNVPDAKISWFDTKNHNFWLNEDDLLANPQKLKVLIDYGNSLLPLFNKSDLNKKDSYGNNALHYAVMTKNSKPLEHFKPSGLEILKKNDLGANLWHFAFLPAPAHLPKAYVEAELKIINKYLLENFKPSYLRFMTLGNPLNTNFPQVYPFELFAYKFQNNNPELYKTLKTKYPEAFAFEDEKMDEMDFNKEEIENLFNQLIIPQKAKSIPKTSKNK